MRQVRRRLFRSKDKVIAGVCGGIADYFEFDPVIIRLIFLSFFFAGFGLPLYLIAWIFIPKK